MLLASFVVSAATKPPQLSGRDFQQLMEAAVVSAAAPSQVQPLTSTICVKQQLKAPLTNLSSLRGWFGKASGPGRASGSQSSNASIAAAMSAQFSIAHQTSMPRLPAKFVLVDATPPPQCVVSHSAGRGPNWKQDEAVVGLSFSRPVLAKGYAFIEEYEECPGLCGTTFLRVFKNSHGKWMQVAVAPLSVS